MDMKHLEVLQGIVEDNLKSTEKHIETALVNSMNQLNIGMISFALNGDNSDFDCPRAYLTLPDNSFMSDEPYYTREIIVVVNTDDKIYVIQNTDEVDGDLLDTLEEFTHFTKEDTEKMMKKLNPLLYGVVENYEVLNHASTMVQLLDCVKDALYPIEEPLTESINVAD